MVVRETEHEIIMVRQHDHAQLSGEIAKHFKNFFTDDPYFEDTLFAIYQHDLGWVRLDEVPMWNDRTSRPFSFMDFPLLPKLTHYTYGLDQIESLNKYAGLLCSLHYASFGSFQNSTVPDCIDFSRKESLRQQRIIDELSLTSQEDWIKPFRLLQLCDRVSLYVCINDPGVRKKQENSRYVHGFEDSELFNRGGEGLLAAEWANDKEITISPNPFDQSFAASLKQKHVSKKRIQEVGIAEAFNQSAWVEQEVIFRGGS